MFSLEMLNSWYIIRFMGLLAYFFFTMSIFGGMLGRIQAFKRQKAVLFQIHLLSAWTGLFTVLIHLLFLLIDTYEPFTLLEIVIPFTAEYESFASALGTISFYLFLLVIFTSDVLLKKLPRALWKNLHLLVFPAWFGMLIHGFLIGTDTYHAGIFTFYIGSFLAIFIAYIFKRDEKNIPKKRSVSRS